MMPNLLKKYQNSLLLMIVLMTTIIIYYKSVHFEFINWDDDRQVYENKDIKLLSASNIKKMFSSAYLKMYQPLTTLSYAVEYKIKGADPHIYHLHNFKQNKRVRIKTFVSKNDPKVKSITDLFSGANWMERETFDFYGIQFEGHPNLKRILNVEYMDYFPMRKEYPLEDQSRKDKDDRYFGR